MSEFCFKLIPGLPDYIIYRNGNIASLYYETAGRPIMLKQQKDSYGYKHVGLCANGKARQYQVHYLIALAFIGPRPDGYVIDHIDGNRANNDASNLRYIKRADNSKTSTAIARCRAAGHCNSAKAVEQLDKSGNVIARYPSIYQAEKASGVRGCHITEVCHGTRVSRSGTYWRFA